MCGGKVGEIASQAVGGARKTLRGDVKGAIQDVYKIGENFSPASKLLRSFGQDKMGGVIYGNEEAATQAEQDATNAATAQAKAVQDAEDAASTAAGKSSLAQRRKSRASSLLSGALNTQGTTTSLGGNT